VRRPLALVVVVLSLGGCLSHVQRARDLFAAGDEAGAVAALEQALREDPDDVEARLELARHQVGAGELVAAESHLRRAVEAAPERDDGRLALADVLEKLGVLPQAAHQLVEVRQRSGSAAVPDERVRDLLQRAAARLTRQGDYAGAIAQYERLVSEGLVAQEELAGPLESAWAAEASRLASEGRRDAAVSAWAEAEALDPAEPEYAFARGRLLAAMDRPVDAEGAFDVYLRRSGVPAERATAAERVGRWYAAREEHDAAVPYYEEAQRKAPGEARLLLSLAELHLKRRDLVQAEAVYTRYIQLAGETPGTLKTVGEQARSLGARRLAERYLERAFAVAPASFDVATTLASLLVARGAREEAVRVMETFIEASPERARGAFRVGQWAAGQDDAPLAIRAYEESVQLNPDRTVAFLRLSELYGTEGRTAEADRALDRYVEASRDKATAHLAAADRLRAQRRYEPAARHIRQAVALRPKDPGPLRALGRVYRAARRPEEEARALDALVEVTPDKAAVLLEIGMDYRRRGDSERAIRFLARASEADGPLEERRRALYLLGDVYRSVGDFEAMKGVDERYLALAPDEATRARALEGLARRYRKAHLVDAYLWALAEQVKLQPDRAELHLRLGSLHLRRNDRDSASAAFRRFVARADDPVEALRQVAGEYQKANDFDAALGVYRRIREVAPGDLRYLQYTADLYRSRDNEQDYRERAAALYEQLLTAPSAKELDLALLGHDLYEGRYHSQAARAYELLLAGRELTGIYAFELAVCYLHTGRVDRARDVFASWLADEGGDAEDHLEVARQYKARRLYDDALPHYDQVLAHAGPKLDEAFGEAADLLVRQAKKDALRTLARGYIENAGNELKAREQAAQQYASAGLLEEAVAEWRRILALRPNHGAALQKLANLLWTMGRSEEAAAFVSRLIEEGGGRERNWLSAAAALKDRGAYTASLEFYDRAVEAGAAVQETHLPRGELLLKLGRVDEAREAFDRAVAASRSQRALFEQIGALYEHFGRTNDAIALWQRATTVDPKHPDHYGRLVRVLLQRGDVQRARRTLLAARVHAPGSLFPVAQAFEAAGHARYAAALYDEVLEAGLGQHARATFERLAALRLAQGQIEALVPAIQRFVTTARSRPEALRVVAGIYAKAGHFEQALAHAVRALREEPKDEAFAEAARYALLAGREEDALRTAVRRVEAAESPDDAALDALADLVGRGREDLARRLAERLEARRLSTGVTGKLLVALRLLAGDVSGGLAAARGFLGGRDDPAVATRELAGLLQRRGFLREAADLLRVAAARSEARGAAQLDLAEVLFEAGDESGGRDALRRYAEARLGEDTEEEIAYEVGATLHGAGLFTEAAKQLRVAFRHPSPEKARRALRWLLLSLSSSDLPEADLDRAVRAFLSVRADTRKAYVGAAETLRELHLLEAARGLLREALVRFPTDERLTELGVLVAARRGDDAELAVAVDAFLNGEEHERDKRLLALAEFFEHELRPRWAGDLRARLLETAPGSRRALLGEARSRLLSGDLALAETLLGRYLSEAEDAPEAERQAAGLWLEVGDGRRAASHAQRAADGAPGDARGWYALFLARVTAGDLEGAEAPLGRYLALAPDAVRARLFAARRLLYRGDLPRSGGALTSDPTSARRALELLSVSSEGAPGLHEAALWREGARVLLGDTEAVAPLERALAVAPGGPLTDPLRPRRAGEPKGFALLVADLLLAAGQTDAADRVLVEVVRTAESPEERLPEVFQLCRQRRSADLMVLWIDRLDRWYPDNGYQVTYLAEALEVAGDIAGAEAAYRQALEREPRAGVYMNNLAYLYGRQGTNLEEAIRLVRRARQLQPQSSKFYLDTEGWVLYRLGRLEEARARILASIHLMDARTGGAVGESFYHLGVVARDLGDRERARTAFWKAAAWDRHGEYGRKSRTELEALDGGE